MNKRELLHNLDAIIRMSEGDVKDSLMELAGELEGSEGLKPKLMDMALPAIVALERVGDARMDATLKETRGVDVYTGDRVVILDELLEMLA